jgi:prepilin-type N-terminal cleavage/methylation domain-containing protein
MIRGFTLVELLIAIIIVALMAAIGFPTLTRQMDRLAVNRAAIDLSATYQSARLWAVYHGSRVRSEFSEASLRGVAEGATDSVFLDVPGPARYRVRLTASRPSIRLGPTGLGLGAANTKLVLVRGEVAESLATSRLGRLRRYP